MWYKILLICSLINRSFSLGLTVSCLRQTSNNIIQSTNELLGNWHNFSTWMVQCYANRTFCALCVFTRDWVEIPSGRVPLNQPKNSLPSLCRLCNCWGGKRKEKKTKISRRFFMTQMFVNLKKWKRFVETTNGLARCKSLWNDPITGNTA